MFDIISDLECVQLSEPGKVTIICQIRVTLDRDMQPLCLFDEFAINVPCKHVIRNECVHNNTFFYMQVIISVILLLYLLRYEGLMAYHSLQTFPFSYQPLILWGPAFVQLCKSVLVSFVCSLLTCMLCSYKIPCYSCLVFS